MNKKKNTKRHAKTHRSPALVPPPEKLDKVLKLVNLLPGCIRHPKWAVMDRNFEQLPGLQYRIEELLNWRPGEESDIAFIAKQLHKEIPEEFAINTSSHLWMKLSITLGELPLLLQAFVLNDDDGKFFNLEYGQGESSFSPMTIEADFQIENNLNILGFNEDDLKRIVRVSMKRIELAFSQKEEERASDKIRIPHFSEVEIEGSTYLLRSADNLVLRVRQRLIYIMAVQELISCLTHPKPQEQLLWYCSVVPRSDAFRPIPYIKEGNFTLRTPTLFYCLEGIETRRVRECPICYQFFWAGRLDMKCCSTKCSHALRARKYRLAYKEKYAYQRYQRSKKEEQSKSR